MVVIIDHQKDISTAVDAGEFVDAIEDPTVIEFVAVAREYGGAVRYED